VIYVPPPPAHAIRKSEKREKLLGVEELSTELTPEEMEEFNAAPGRQRRLKVWRAMLERVFKPGTAEMFRMLKREAWKVRKKVLRWVMDHADVPEEPERSVRGTSIDPTALQALLLRLQEEWAAQVQKGAGPIYLRAADQALNVLSHQIGGFTSMSVAHPEVVKAIAARTVEIKTPIEGTVKMLRETLAKGVAEGKTTQEMARLVRDRFGMVERASKMIARTEIAGAANKVRHVGMEVEGIAGREWITSGDLRVRRTHAAMDGVVALVDEKYPIPKKVKGLWKGPPLKHPHDPHGHASQVIACRCVEGPVLDLNA